MHCLRIASGLVVLLALGAAEQVFGARDSLLMHADGTYEWGYAWWYGEQQEPDFGAFAERYGGVYDVQAVVLDLSASWWVVPRLDAYVWADDAGRPGAVLSLTPNVHPGDVWQYPEYSRHRIELAAPVRVDALWWLGYWGHWVGSHEGYWVGADLDGPGGGRSMTKIAPGLEWPSGWQDVAVRWYPTAALGIGAEVTEVPTPARTVTWGGIKSLFD
jgi:hypothetical protein